MHSFFSSAFIFVCFQNTIITSLQRTFLRRLIDQSLCFIWQFGDRRQDLCHKQGELVVLFYATVDFLLQQSYD